MPLLQLVGEQGEDADHRRSLSLDGLSGLEHRAAGGDEVLDHDDLGAVRDASFDLVAASVVLGGGTDIGHRGTETIGSQRGVGDASGGGPGDDVDLIEIRAHQLGQARGDEVTDLWVREGHAVVAVDR